jgi:hypothetical protein
MLSVNMYFKREPTFVLGAIIKDYGGNAFLQEALS